MNSLIKAIEHECNKTTTQNGENAHKSTMDSLVDLFYFIGGSRNNPDTMIPLFRKAARDDLDTAVRCLLYARDVRGGMGEREAFRKVLHSLAMERPDIACDLIPKVIEVGRFDDLFALFGTLAEEYAIRYWVSEIVNGNVLAAKWAPRTRSANKEYARKIIKVIGCDERAYRLLLKQKSDTVEQLMSSKKWGEIEYEKLPSLASARLGQAFTKNDEVRYKKFVEKVSAGEAKVNAGAVYPYDVIKALRANNDALAQAQWDALKDYVADGVNFLPLVDTSGSMTIGVSGTTTALDVAVSLGMYLAQRNKSRFRNTMITFTDQPSLVSVDGMGLKEAYHEVLRMDWGYNTNFRAVYELILTVAKQQRLTQDDMPDFLIVLSDMQFDEADSAFGETAYQQMKKSFETAGYKIPRMVFWNLNGTDNVPTTKNDVATLVSGFSPSVMKSVLSGKEVKPLETVLDLIMTERYNWM